MTTACFCLSKPLAATRPLDIIPPRQPTALTLSSLLAPYPQPAVLDDNCMLCLPNGERIKLNANTMRMLFEVQDLAVASPATVSRCGMVYVPSEDIGWRPYVL